MAFALISSFSRFAFACLMFFGIAFTSTSADAANIRSVNSAQIIRAMEYSRSQATVLFFYTSWCPYCKQQFPIINDLSRSLPDRELSVVGVSLDKDPLALKQYIGSMSQKPDFEILRLNQNTSGNIKSDLKKLGLDFGGGIPYVAVFSRGGKLVAEFGGLVDKDELVAAITAAAQGKKPVSSSF